MKVNPPFRWRLVKDFIVPVPLASDDKLASYTSYFVFVEGPLTFEELYAKLSLYFPFSRAIKQQARKITIKLASHGFASIDEYDVIKPLIPPIPRSVFQKLLEEHHDKILKNLDVSKHTVKAWRKGTRFPSNEHLREIMKIVGGEV